MSVYVQCEYEKCGYGHKTYYEGNIIHRHFQKVEKPRHEKTPDFGERITWKRCPMCMCKSLIRIPKEVVVKI